MTTLMTNSKKCLPADVPQGGRGSFLVAAENYEMALDELRSAADDLRDALGKLQEILEQSGTSSDQGIFQGR